MAHRRHHMGSGLEEREIPFHHKSDDLHSFAFDEVLDGVASACTYLFSNEFEYKCI